MKRKTKRRFIRIFTAVFCLSTALSQGASYASAGGNDPVKEIAVGFTEVTSSFDVTNLVTGNFNSLVRENAALSGEEKTVIVSLDGETMLDYYTGVGNITAYGANALKSRITDTQNSFYASLQRAGIPYTKVASYDTVDNAVAVRVDVSRVAEIKKMAGVRSAVISVTYLTPTAKAVYNETKVYETGIYDSSDVLDRYSGQGMTVAVLDTGLDYTHPAFQKTPETDVAPVRFEKSDISALLGNSELKAETLSAIKGDAVTADDLYVSAKVPFAYDYADKDADVYPSYSLHGTHVAGIIGGNDENYTDKDGNLVDKPFIGVSPDVQLVICKVFTDDLDAKGLGGAEMEDILSALEDCVKLKVDVINMSLGTTAGFSSTASGDDEGEYMDRVYESVRQAGISLMCAAGNDYSSAYGGTFGTNLASNPDSATVGAPSTYSAALSVASISGQKSEYLLGNGGTDYETAVFYEEANDENSNPYDFADGILPEGEDSADFEYVVIPTIGGSADYTSTIKNLVKGRIALVKRGDITFKEKVELAMANGAIGIIIYNNVSGIIRMSLGEIDDPIPAVSVTMDAGKALVEGAKFDATPNKLVGTVTVDRSLLAGPFMSGFSSWGPAPDLKLKPEITAHGGEITSAVPGGYDELSGTSMATPNLAGLCALVRSYVNAELGVTDRRETTRICNQLIMSTATIVYDETDLPYSPRKQGAGLANLTNIISGTSALLSTDSAENDYRPKLEFYDNLTGVYGGSFNVENFVDTSLCFDLSAIVMTETLASDGLAVAEKAYIFGDVTPTFTVTGGSLDNGVLTVSGGETAKVSVTIRLNAAAKRYIEKSFKNGMFVEGFITLTSRTEGQCDLSLPFLGFYGDWADSPLLDYDVFEIAEIEKDTSKSDSEKEKASVWATQAYASYYNDRYVLPIGGYIYTLPENDTPMYTEEDHGSISRYNEYVSEDGLGNYMTANGIEALYAGLFRNTEKVTYSLINADTGEAVFTDKVIYRVGKAYSDGGGARPAFLELKLDAEEQGLVNNGKYKMSFLFDRTGDGENTDTFEFTFYVDYDSPVLTDSRVRFYNYKQGNKTKQRVYLDLDVYDNHYAQSVMLCYLDWNEKSGRNELMLATEYATPVRNAVKNGTTTVSLEITDIYEKYKDRLYVQVDDYALNHCVYSLNLTAANREQTPESFTLSEEYKNVELGVNETKKVQLEYQGNADLSNFTWTSSNNSVVLVKNGELFGVREGTASVTVTGKSGRVTIRVTVKASGKTLSPPSLSFGTIKDYEGSLVKASGAVKVNSGEKFTLEILTDPWYYPKDTLEIEWKSENTDVATVDDGGNVATFNKGSAVISATIKGTAYSANVTLQVQEQFTVSNYTLRAYHGNGGKVVIPTDMNIMYIGEEAFKNNSNITEIVIPKSVMRINEKAFYGCSALEKVSFIQDGAMEIADADLTLIARRAFYGCPKLKTVDLSNVKTITLGRECFALCTALTDVIKITNIGTMCDGAFYGCSALTSVDLTKLHVAGKGVFENCAKLSSVTTDAFSVIGEEMFKNCSALTEITLSAPNIGKNAFNGCGFLAKVTFENPQGATPDFYIGEYAFNGCVNLAELSFGNCNVVSIGDGAFSDTALTEFTLPSTVKNLGSGILSGCRIERINLSADGLITAAYVSASPFAGITPLFTVPENGEYSVIEGVIYSADLKRLVLVPAGKTDGFTVPDTVTEICANAFYGNTSVSSVSGTALFFTDGSSCALNGLKTIGDYAFYGSVITAISLPRTVESLGKYAFARCVALTQVAFEEGGSLEYIGDGAFSDTAVTEIYFPNSVKELGDGVLKNSRITSARFGGNKMGNETFYGCAYLTDVDIADTVTVMGDRTFAKCSALENVVLPAVTSLGAFTFDGATALKTVAFHKDATTVGISTFDSSPALTRLTSVTLGEGTETIGAYAFYRCSALTYVDIGNATAIESYAFCYCTALSEVAGIDNVTYIGNGAFYGCSSLTQARFNACEYVGENAFADSALVSADLPVAVVIGKNAFAGTAITDVTLSETVEYIGDGAFSDNAFLTAITVAEDNARFFTENGALYSVLSDGVYELTAYPCALNATETDGKKTLTVIDGTVSVRAFAFCGLNSGAIESIVLPYSLKTIGDGAFYGTDIGEYLFYSIQAPVLQTVYRSEVSDFIESTGGSYDGYFYRNFDKDYVVYSEFGTETPTAVIKVPTNGVGYDNLVYSVYFGENVKLGVLMDDYTRDTAKAIDDLPSAETVQGFAELAVTEENKAIVKKASEDAVYAHSRLNNILDPEQKAFLGEDRQEKLSQVETALRSVKVRFGIPFSVLSLSPAGEYKTDYVAGEKFDMTGLTVIIEYDDYSTAVADSKDVVLITDGELDELDRTVTVSVGGQYLYILINVTEKQEQEIPVDPEKPETPAGGCSSSVGFNETFALWAAVAALSVCVRAVIVKRGKRQEKL